MQQSEEVSPPLLANAQKLQLYRSAREYDGFAPCFARFDRYGQSDCSSSPRLLAVALPCLPTCIRAAKLAIATSERRLICVIPQDQPVTKGSSFADVELAENNANYVKTFDALVGDKGRKHLMPKRGIAIICWCAFVVFRARLEARS